MFAVTSLRQFADSKNPRSFANKLRARRFRQFEALVAGLPRPLHILDVGGTNAFWENRGWGGREDVRIWVANLTPEPRRHSNIVPVQADATDLAEFPNASFEVVFSNSVIEHLFTLEKQRRMALEIQRVGKRYWVQTPNFWFPIEPHFHVVGWQWMPVAVRVAIIRRISCGWRGPCPSPEGAKNLVQEIRLLTRPELKRLFPGATLVAERFCGLVKSWILVGGFE